MSVRDNVLRNPLGVIGSFNTIDIGKRLLSKYIYCAFRYQHGIPGVPVFPGEMSSRTSNGQLILHLKKTRLIYSKVSWLHRLSQTIQGLAGKFKIFIYGFLIEKLKRRFCYFNFSITKHSLFAWTCFNNPWKKHNSIGFQKRMF